MNWVLTIIIMVVDLNDNVFEISLLLIPPCAFRANERLRICAFAVMARSGSATQSAFGYFASTAKRVSWKSRHDGLGSVNQINYGEDEPYYQATRELGIGDSSDMLIYKLCSSREVEVDLMLDKGKRTDQTEP